MSISRPLSAVLRKTAAAPETVIASLGMCRKIAAPAPVAFRQSVQ